jgi:hypothetical protein
MAMHRLRQVGLADPAHLAAYCQKNPDRLSAELLEEMSQWAQHGLTGQFIVLQQRKDGCLLLSTERAPAVYLVLGITNSFRELAPFLPCYLETWLLPWRGRIVTDGLIMPTMAHFGPSMRSGFSEEAQEIIATQGLITSLPAGAFTGPDPAAQLQHYLSTAAHRRDFAPQIKQLRQQRPELEASYLQAMGQVNAKALKASLRRKGLTGHFAILEDTIVAGAKDKPSATICAHSVVPAALHPALVWIKV